MPETAARYEADTRSNGEYDRESLPTAPSTALTQNQSAVIAQIRAELDTQILTAKQYPRDIKRAIENSIAMATYNDEIADGCIYAKPVGKNPDGTQKFQRGCSIRLAEIMIANWGNIRVTPRIVERDARFITVDCTVWDLETNNQTAWVCCRRLTDKYGKPYAENVVENTIGAATAIAMRNGTFKVIPKAYADIVYQACAKIVFGNTKSLAEKRANVIAGLVKLGIEEKRILATFHVSSVDLIDADMVLTLKGLGTAIRDGEITIEEAFPDPNGKTPETQSESKGTDAVKDKVKNRAGSTTTKTDEPRATTETTSAAEANDPPRGMDNLSTRDQEMYWLGQTPGWRPSIDDLDSCAQQYNQLMDAKKTTAEFSALTPMEIRSCRLVLVGNNAEAKTAKDQTGSLLGEGPAL